jgi:hypothetical protein
MVLLVVTLDLSQTSHAFGCRDSDLDYKLAWACLHMLQAKAYFYVVDSKSRRLRYD